MSGTTLLSRMLGRLPTFVAVGEVGHVWDKSLIDGRECGCGRRVDACPFWREVGLAAFGGWDRVDAREATRLRGRLLLRGSPLPHPFALPLILQPRISSKYAQDLARYGDLLVRLYDGIAQVSGSRIIVDSMKVPAHVYAVCTRPDMDGRVLHVVRDSRGVAYSNTKLVKRQGEGYRVRRTPSKSARRWLWINQAFRTLERRGVPTTVVRYETFVRSPREELRRIAEWVGAPLDETDLAFIGPEGVTLAEDHLIAGNRVRFERGPIILRTDEDWRTGLSRAQRLVVTTWSWPLLRRFGYVSSPRGE